MADGAGLSNYQNWLYELQGEAQKLFPAEFVLLAILSGVIREDGGYIKYDQSYERFTRAMDGNREVFDGSSVRFPLMLAGLPAGGNPSESSTWNAPAPIDTSKANVNLGRVLQPLAISLDLERDSKSGSTSAMSAVENYIGEAYKAAAKIENDELHGGVNAIGTGTGSELLANVTSATGSGTLVVPVGTGANFDQLTPGRVLDILTRSTGANPGNGLRRKIASVSRTAGTVTFDTAQVASDGSSGNITFSANEGIYIPGSWGNGLQSLAQAVATTGSFEGVNKATVQQWAGVDATPSSVQALSDQVLDNAVYLLRGNGVGASDFGIAHPKTVDLYKQSKAAMTRLDPKEVVVPSGFAGIEYQGADRPFPILKDLAAPRGVCRLITRDALRLYGDHVGPSFIDDDGSMWRFFSRNFFKEGDLYDRVQLAVKACNKLATIGNATTLLSEAQ
jgi:hypothetical protein